MNERVPSLGGKIFLNPSLAVRPSIPAKPTLRTVHYNARFFSQQPTNDSSIHINPHFLGRTVQPCIQKPVVPLRPELKIHVNPNFNPNFLEPEKCAESKRPTVLFNPKFLSAPKKLEVRIHIPKVAPKPCSLKLRTKHKLVMKHQSPVNPSLGATSSKSTPLSTVKRLSKYKFVRTMTKVDGDVTCVSKTRKTPLRVLSKYSMRRASVPLVRTINPKPLPKSPFSTSQVSSVLRSHIAARRFSRLNNILLLRKVLSPRNVNESTSAPFTTQKVQGKLNPEKSLYKLRKTRKLGAWRRSQIRGEQLDWSLFKTFWPLSSSSAVKNDTPRKTNFVAKSKLKKDNQHCKIFNRFGRCKGKERGLCTKVHDPKYVSLCKRFLKGECIDLECTYSHSLIPEKMPTCHHYLAGRCSRMDCPFLHVKLSTSAPICRQFLDGYCSKGIECSKRHVYLCPLIAEKGNCPKGVKCLYPHLLPSQPKPSPIKNKQDLPLLPKKKVEVTKGTPLAKKPTTSVKKTMASTSSRYFSKPDALREEVEKGALSPSHSPQKSEVEGEVEEATALDLLKLRPTSPLRSFIPIPNYPSDTE